MTKITENKHSTPFLIKTICLICLLLLPINLAAFDDDQLQKIESDFNANPGDQTLLGTLVNAYNDKAVELAAQKQWSAAEDYLKKALALTPTSKVLIKNLSTIYFKHSFELYQDPKDQNYTLDNHSSAKQLAQQAIALDPQNFNAYILLGDIEYMNQHMPEAQKAWQQAAILLPNNQQVQDRLAKVTRETETEDGMIQKYDLFFNIKIDPQVANLRGFDISQALNTARVLVSTDLLYSQPSKIPVNVYTMKQYKETLKDAPQWSEGAYDGKIRLILAPDQKDFRQTKSNIVHEYTHAVVGDLSNNQCPKWLNEGLAKYEEYKHGVKPQISVLAIAYNSNSILAWDKINDYFLDPSKNQVLLAYQQSFSFVYFIVQKYGMSRLVSLLKALGTKSDFPTAVMQSYNVSLEALEKDWQNWLTTFIHRWSEDPIPRNY